MLLGALASAAGLATGFVLMAAAPLVGVVALRGHLGRDTPPEPLES